MSRPEPIAPPIRRAPPLLSVIPGAPTDDRRRWRRQLRDTRRALRGVERQHAEAGIATAIGDHPWFARANRVLAYRAFDGEVGLDAVLRHAVAAGKQVLFAQARRGAPLRFVLARRWRSTASGCPVPIGPSVPFAADDLMLVPGVGFTARGHRLGMGGGHYDRTLASCQVRTLGVAFACQLVSQLPHDRWDQPVDAVATELGSGATLDPRSA